MEHSTQNDKKCGAQRKLKHAQHNIMAYIMCIMNI